MKNINILLPFFNNFKIGILEIEQNIVQIKLELKDGKQKFISKPIKIGTFANYKVFAFITIPYIYDKEFQYITLPGEDNHTRNQITIHTNLENNHKISNFHTFNDYDNLDYEQNLWKDFTENTPEFKNEIKNILHKTIAIFVQKLLEQGINGVIQTGQAPIINRENFQDFKNMLKPEIKEIVEPSLDDIFELQSIIASTYYGTITWNLNYSFANIIGSTNDPKPSGFSSWILLLAYKCNNGHYPSNCSSYNYANGHTPFGCNTSDFVGGHVIPGQVASVVAKGGTAYIFPICKAHNGNDNIYMSMRYNPIGVVLHNYNLG